jgi:hypothetical protein
MKRQAKQPNPPQMHLPLLHAPATAVPGHKQKELALTLMEILINAACQKDPVLHANGGGDEPPKAHR